MSLKPPIRLAICTPTAGYVRIEFAESLARLQKELALDRKLPVRDTKLFYIAGSVIPYNRQWCVQEALKWKATHILFIDDDMSFMPDVIKRLLKNADLPVVACNCTKRVYPITFMSLDFAGQEVKTTDETVGLQEVMMTGNAVVLIQAEVFNKLSKPWFAFPYYPKEDIFETEDYYFNRKVTEAGYPIVIDHDASKGVIHVGSHHFIYDDRFHKNVHRSMNEEYQLVNDTTGVVE